MSVVAFTFGSFGDILATVQLLAKAAATVKGIPSGEQRALLFEIQSLSGVLVLAKEIVERYYSNSNLDIATNLAISVNQEVSQCRLILQRFLDKAVCYKRPLAQTSINSLWKSVWWAAVETTEINNLQAKLANHRSHLTLLLLGLNLCAYFFYRGLKVLSR